MKRRARIIAPADAEGVPLLEYLSGRFTYHDRDTWSRVIEEGRIRIGGTVTRGDCALHAGDDVEYTVPDLPEPAVDPRFEVVFRDSDLLIVNKSGNLPCHPGGIFFRHTLWAVLRDAYPGEALHFVNRLDRETSGLVWLASSGPAVARCRRLMDRRRVTKTYLVLVEGVFPDRLHASGALLPDEFSPVRKKRRFIPGSAEGETADTLFRCLATRDGISAVQAEPVTGRTHQIRATLRSLGYPVLGDKLYGIDEHAFLRFIGGNESEADMALLRLPRQALHAWRLALRHPVTGEAMCFEAPVPDDLRAFACVAAALHD